jgi:hypothetical protein
VTSLRSGVKMGLMKKLLAILVLGLKHYLLHLKGYARTPSENSV